MAQEFTNLSKAFEAFECSLQEGRYYDAHEDLEPLWFVRRFENDDEVRLWKGFINAAVSFELIKRGRYVPSKKAWSTYQKYLPLMESADSHRYPIYARMATIIEEIYHAQAMQMQGH